MVDKYDRGFVRLNDNRIPVYYKGGKKISEFRKLTSAVSGPEDWVGSTCCLPAGLLPAGGSPKAGLSNTEYGYFTDLIEEDPTWWLGSRFKSLPDNHLALLVKLLDAGERLPVHAHPSRPFAQKHLNSTFGKTEGWIILHADAGSKVWLGLKEDMTKSAFAKLVELQNSEAMLAEMNEFFVTSGDVIYVPAGTLHSIGAGVFLVELQEPTSYSILCEYLPFGVSEEMATLGLGWDLALGEVDLKSKKDARNNFFSSPKVFMDSDGVQIRSLFPEKSEIFFTALELEVTNHAIFLIDQLNIAVVSNGSAEIHITGTDASILVTAGDTFAIPAGVESITINGSVKLILCRPPEG